MGPWLPRQQTASRVCPRHRLLGRRGDRVPLRLRLHLRSGSECGARSRCSVLMAVPGRRVSQVRLDYDVPWFRLDFYLLHTLLLCCQLL